VAEAKVIDGKAIAAEVRGRVAGVAARLHNEINVTAGLATVLVGSDWSNCRCRGTSIPTGLLLLSTRRKTWTAFTRSMSGGSGAASPASCPARRKAV